MTTLSQSSLRNRLLALAPAQDFDLLSPYLEAIELPRRTDLAKPGRVHDYVYFLEAGLASQVMAMDERHQLEVGIYGRDGVGPTAVLLGVDRGPHHHFIQIAGHGHRISAVALASALASSVSLRAFFLRYVQTTLVQITHTAASNGRSSLDKRLARWLLMCHDRIDGDAIALTHEFLGIMLGVRRAGVTTALQLLEGQGIIRAGRSLISVRDRHLLEAVAGNSYGVPESEYARLIGPMS